MTGSYGRSVFKSLRNLHTVPHHGCSSSHSRQQQIRVPLFPHSHQHLLFLYFWMIVILIGVRWYFIVVSICNSVMVSDPEHFFMCLLATCHQPKICSQLLCFIKEKTFTHIHSFNLYSRWEKKSFSGLFQLVRIEAVEFTLYAYDYHWINETVNRIKSKLRSENWMSFLWSSNSDLQ